MMDINKQIALELSIRPEQVQAAVTLLDDGATVPFISRYRKEVTGSLDDTILRNLEERLAYLRELEERKLTILKSIKEQEKLTPELEKAILSADTKTRVEDLYLPYKPKRRTKAQIAKEAGIEPLALAILNDQSLNPEQAANAYVNVEKGFTDIKAVLDGAKQILMENFAENAELIGQIRDYLWQHAKVIATVVKGKEEEGQKFSDYYSYEEPINKIPSHRALAILRGRREGILNLTLVIPEPENQAFNEPEKMIAAHFNIMTNQTATTWLNEVVRWTWKIKVNTQLELEIINDVRKKSETEAIHVFAENLRALLLAAPAGMKVTMGLDPGLRTGVKVVVVDATGKLLEYVTIYPHVPRKEWDKSIQILATLCEKHNVELISIGNGTASRETEKLVSELTKQHKALNLSKIVVSEAGASVYSASALAAKEFPDLDVTIRGAVSIARRLQDPLAELVKIDPKSIGVGQYQHDVNQPQLAKSLKNVVEDCVNAVGVDLNTASAELLSYIAGLNDTIAQNIIAFRDEKGIFNNRQELLNVTRLGEKTFEQAAGFLRIPNGDNPLDSSSVHPEAYPVVKSILEKNSKVLKEIIGNSDFLKNLRAVEYTDEQFGLPTVTDIIKELEKPGRDPRPEFKTAVFIDGIEEIKDLKEGMVLEGVVSNVANFGAFVDIGVHQDGLVHISELANTFVSDPRTVVKVGDIVKVKVLEVDEKRKRINLTMRINKQGASNKTTETKDQQPRQTNRPKQKSPRQEASPSAMGEALLAALQKK
ncbi:MAG: RNA-binding transcriptional accessory protein [Legionellales bacterium]|nr:RNA-binding transcriptional accessory protein [Legionellales bacterium]